MVTQSRVIAEPPVQWITSAPFWELNADNDSMFRRPEILRFAGDTFMQDFIGVAGQQPQRLSEWRAPDGETWRTPPRQPTIEGTSIEVPAAAPGIKLFQPAHERYYLVTASLVCRIPGLPDKMLDLAKAEKASFVIRRLMRAQSNAPVDPSVPSTFREYAFVGGHWQQVPENRLRALRAGEEVNPLFETRTGMVEGGNRRVLAGLIPVAKHDAFLHAPKSASPDVDDPGVAEPPDPRLIQLEMDVLAPWREIKRASRRAARAVTESVQDSDADDGFGQIKSYAREQRDALQVSSWYVLLDFSRFLKDHLSDVWHDLDNSSTDLTDAQRILWQRLRDTTYNRFDSENEPWNATFRTTYTYLENFLADVDGRIASSISMAAILRRLDVSSVRDGLEAIQVNYPVPPGYTGTPQWPVSSSQFLLSNPSLRHLAPFDESEESQVNPDLETLVADALADVPQTNPTPIVPLAVSLAKSLNGDSGTGSEEGLFVIRCVYDRPNCPPELERTIVSAPTIAFRMAPFFDPDAPARPVRITMPLDTTPGGLRKFAKNTAFVMSDTLACQFEQAQSLSFGDLVLSVLPWPFNKSLPDMGAAECKTNSINIGKICSFSIPIITICALILMLIIVFLLDIIFKWVPYLFLCLPIPGLKSKD